MSGIVETQGKVGNFSISGKIDGLDSAMAALQSLQKKSSQTKVLRKALTAATKPMLDTAKATVPRESGLLRKSLGRKVKTYSASGTVIVMIGPRSKPSFRREVTIKTKFGRSRTVIRNPVKYAHLVEYGTKPHKVGKLSHPGSPPRPFLRPAFDAHKAEATATFGREVYAGIKDVIMKARAKGKVA